MMFRWHRHDVKPIGAIPEPAQEYEVAISDIKITAQFEATKPGKRKLENKKAYYDATGRFTNPCVLVSDNTLVDGYCTYVLTKRLGLKTVTCIYIGDGWKPMDGINLRIVRDKTE